MPTQGLSRWVSLERHGCAPIMMSNQQPGTHHLLIRKLEALVCLSVGDRAALERLSANVFPAERNVELLGEGEVPTVAVIVLEGFACRYKHRVSGARQIMAYLVPGDLCDVDAPFLGRMDHAIGTLSACLVECISRSALAELMEEHPTIARALRLTKLAEEATSREWLVNLGTRQAAERVAHLFCELLTRLGAVGLAKDGCHALPITQLDMADTLGLSNVHMNRSLQSLRRQGLIELRSQCLKVLDLPRLQALAEFSPAYLQPALR